MAIVRWEPFEGLTSLRREMDRLFENFFERSPFSGAAGGMFEPAVEVADTNESITVKAQVPGVSKDNLYVDVTNDALTLRGEMKQEEKTEDRRYFRQEFRYGAFSRTIPLPASVQADQASAQLKDGVLTITIPKGAESKTKQIPIQTAGAGAQPQGDSTQTTRAGR
jgi:HSP20 family protein